MRGRRVRITSLLWLVLLGGLAHPVAQAGHLSDREVVIVWHYPHARLHVDCSLPGGTVVSSVAVPLPEHIPVGISALSTDREVRKDWVMLKTNLPGLKVRAALDRNGGPRADGEGQQTLLRLELVTDDAVHSGWLTVPPQPLWWEVYDTTTRIRQWRARIVWKGRMKVETEDNDAPEEAKGCS